MDRFTMRTAGALALCIAFAAAPPAVGIETDQYYAWGRPLGDSTDVLNAKVNLEIRRVLERVGRDSSWERRTCHQLSKRIDRHFRLFIFHDLELWALNTSLVDRIPATPEEELEFRRRYIYHATSPVDPVRMIPPSPTIELNGVRVGTDKLTHFLSEGWWYYSGYRKARRRGRSHEEAVRRAIDRGILSERTILGKAASGVFSVADLEANYQGLRFLLDLCEGDEPLLQKTDRGWVLRRPFDFREYVGPEWDESYAPSIFSKRRWKRVRPLLRRYCPMLDSPVVQRRRERYARMERPTPTAERLRELVARGKLPDPRQYSIERLCEQEEEGDTAAGAEGLRP